MHPAEKKGVRELVKPSVHQEFGQQNAVGVGKAPMQARPLQESGTREPEIRFANVVHADDVAKPVAQLR
jgi:hypothetical protein